VSSRFAAVSASLTASIVHGAEEFGPVPGTTVPGDDPFGPVPADCPGSPTLLVTDVATPDDSAGASAGDNDDNGRTGEEAPMSPTPPVGPCSSVPHDAGHRVNPTSRITARRALERHMPEGYDTALAQTVHLRVRCWPTDDPGGHRPRTRPR